MRRVGKTIILLRRFLKYLQDYYKPKLKFILFVSSSLKIKKKFTDRLSGRVYPFIVLPLDFEEWALL
ncbi:MAG TPA: AAA family ATPase [Candidatus Bathyarchaeia archaeon]|nr:AAA family ATPase [Candidatus Bathyarchaeia archaeon]